MLPHRTSRTVTYALAAAASATLAVAAAPAADAASGQVDVPFTERATLALGTLPGQAEVRAIAVRSDGRIIAVSNGTVPGGTSADIVVRRLLPDGSLDPSFDGDGVAVIDTLRDDTATAVAVRPDGKIVIAGTTSNGIGDADVVVFRLNADGGSGEVNGALDPSFDGDGAAGAGTSGSDYANAAALLPDGRILVAVTAVGGTGSTQDATVYRFRADGGPGGLNEGLDPSFDDDGRAVVDTQGAETANAIALRPDGTIVVAGTTGSRAAGWHAIVFQLKPEGGPGGVNGALDPGFDEDGMAGLSVGADTYAEAIALQPDGRILVAGETRSGPVGTDAVVWRLRKDGGPGELNGALDPSFGTGGRAFGDAGGSETVWSIGVLPDNRIVTAGRSVQDDDEVFAFALLPEGTPDARFGEGGTTVVRYGADASAYALGVQPDGAVVLGGQRDVGRSERGLLLRLTGEPPVPGPAEPQPGGPGAPGGGSTAPSAGRKPGGAGAVGGSRRREPAATGAFGAATRVTAQRSGRRVRLTNRNAFAVRVRVRVARRRATTVTVGARATRTVKVAAVRGRLRVTAIDPAGTTRAVAVRRVR